MLKTLVTSLLVLYSLTSLSQEIDAEAISLIEQLHQPEIEKKLIYFVELQQQQSPNGNKIVVDDLYRNIAKVYTKRFTSDELMEIHAFYNSPLGKKITTTRVQLQEEVTEVITNWEKKALGIEDPPEMTEEEHIKMINSIKASYNADVLVKEEPEEESYPDIVALEDLRKILMDKPYLINDQKLLEKVLGPDVDIEKLFIPNEEEMKLEMEKEKNR